MFFISLYKHFLGQRTSAPKWVGQQSQREIEPSDREALEERDRESRRHAENAMDAVTKVRESYFLERRSIL